MNEYMLIFRHEDGSKIASPEQMQIWMKQTMDWIGGIAAQNKFSGGNGLPMDEARVVKADKMVTNGPFGEIKETIGGYIIVKADSIDEAVEFAKGCPVLQGELYKETDREKAKGYFQKAQALAKTPADIQTISKKLGEL
ncbi:MAG: transcription initiation protein [Chitinophagaceae bacterium]|nr:transcription initiation protein [Chitinophagaceae bacterium]